MKLYKSFINVDSDAVKITTALNKWIKTNYKKYNYKIATPLEDETGVYGVIIAYWPRLIGQSKSHTEN